MFLCTLCYVSTTQSGVAGNSVYGVVNALNTQPYWQARFRKAKSTFESKGILDVHFKSRKMWHKEINIVVEKYSKLASRDRNCKINAKVIPLITAVEPLRF